jgi:hypothetical protein
MTSWKAVAVFGGAGFLLSLLFGLFAGNPFGVVLLRVLLSSLGSAGLGFGLFTVIGRFLPEMLGAAGSPAERGEHVDIVLPGENPHAAGIDAGEQLGIDDAVPADEPESAVSEAEDAEEIGGVDDLGAVGIESGAGAAGTAEQAGGSEEGETDPVEEADAEAVSGGLGARVSSGGLEGLGSRSRTVSAGGRPEDPETVARALRTMMKRDEEG